EACNFWHEYGIKRIVLARELSLDDIRLIRANVPDTLELEAFVHGSMCVSYSGRCLLSNYYTNRNANDGKCAQPCRWKYFINEEKRQNDVLSAEQDNNGTYIFSSKDLCMIEHANDLLSCGINSLKIEGRMKSVYYTACVTNIYKLALADAAENKPFNPLYFDEINGVSHREYCSGYFYSNPTDEANIVNTNEYLREKAFLCTITEYDVSTGLAKCIQRNKMSIGDKIQILSPGKLGKDIEILTLYDAEMAEIQSTPHAKMEFYARFSLPSNSSDIIRAK
ncbi:MAG: U32 family peptidase C-terminal domain-containing protein, partial [Clostridia bacterium]